MLQCMALRGCRRVFLQFHMAVAHLFSNRKKRRLGTQIGGHGSHWAPPNFEILKNFRFFIFFKKWSNLGFLAPEKDSPDDLEEIPQKIVQKYALAATFWAKTKN